MKLKTLLLLAVLLPAAASAAEDNPLTSQNKFMYSVIKNILLRSAEKMPEEHYGFRPAPTVRTYGEILGHVADSQYYFCSVALGQKANAPKNEKVKTSKAELIAALKDAFTYCDTAYDTMTDAKAVEMIKFMRGDSPRFFALMTNQMHTIEHYGNLVTYMRMKDIVPPTSEPGFLEAQQKK